MWCAPFNSRSGVRRAQVLAIYVLYNKCSWKLVDDNRDPDDVEEGEDFTANLNPSSLEILGDCRVEPSLVAATSGDRYQFERTGYFCVDPDSSPERLVFNRTVGLRDTWAKIQKRSRKRGTGT